MPTECSAESFEFGIVEGRPVEAAFDGGLVTSDAGALLLGATDRAIGMMDRFAACFSDARRADLIEHTVVTLVGQRVYAIALGYEDLNDHDELRHDPMMAVLAGKLAARREECAPVGREIDAQPAGAEQAGTDALPQDQPQSDGDPEPVCRSVPRGACACSTADHSRPRCDGRSAAWRAGGTVLPRVLRLLLLSAALRVLRPRPSGGQAAARRSGCGIRGGRRGGAPCRAHPRMLAAHPHPVACRLGLCARRTDGLVRGP